MKLTLRFQQLARSDVATWSSALLEPCTLDELEALARMLAVPHSGTKPERIERIISAVLLRKELSTWGEFDGDAVRAREVADVVAKQYNRPALVRMARRAGIFHGVPKPGIALGLLQWRDRCRLEGTRFYTELQAGAVKQYAMNLEDA